VSAGDDTEQRPVSQPRPFSLAHLTDLLRLISYIESRRSTQSITKMLSLHAERCSEQECFARCHVRQANRD